ncbi:MAG: helix-turn-helix transcriptional regulator [Candidatus Dormibacteria bacterium]
MQYESGEKFLRVIQLFRRLAETEAGVTTKQLADELAVTQRTVQRYVTTLRDSAGIDIDEIDGRLRIGPGTRLPAMQLNRYQATLLLVALRLVQQLRPEHDPDLVGALAQLSQALRVPLVSSYLERTLRTVESRPLNEERRQVERAVIDGFVDSRALEVHYFDGAGRHTRRTLHPYFLEPAAQGRHLYVFAHDALSGEVRPFRLDRIRSARLLPETFHVPDDFDIDRVISTSWGVWQSERPDHVVLRFNAAGARLLLEQPAHPNAELEGVGAGILEMRIDVASEVEMRPWVLGWGSLVTVVEPPSLRDYVAGAAERISALYR